MVDVTIDVTDLGGEAYPGDRVVLWKPLVAGSASSAGRIISTAPVTVTLDGGKATVTGVEPGPMQVLLRCRGVESQGPVMVTVPDGTGKVTLRSLFESQFEYQPPVVSAVQAAADKAADAERGSISAQVRSENAADRAEERVDEALTNAAGLVRNEVKTDADRAVSARQAAKQSESNAKASENAAASSESNAKQSETNAGNYTAVATTAATEAVDAMESASDALSSIGDSVSAAAGHADRAEQHESGAAAYAQNATDAADRVGTAEQVGAWARRAQDAADRIGTAETVEGWVDSAHNSASAAAQSEAKAEEHRDVALSAAASTSDAIRSELTSIATDASTSASSAKTSETNAATSESNAKVSETNAATHEANSLSAAERAELAAEETIQQVEGDFATRIYVDQRVPVGLFAGTGSPEGAVTAPVGSIYTDTTTTNGAVRWIKTSGTDNTGWVVEYGDTGWRNVTSLLRNGWAATTFLMRRVGHTVEVRATALDGTNATDFMFFTPPQGFLPGAGSIRIPASTSGASVSADRVNISVTGTFSNVWRANMTHTSAALSTTYLTSESWPTTLPGTPA